FCFFLLGGFVVFLCLVVIVCVFVGCCGGGVVVFGVPVGGFVGLVFVGLGVGWFGLVGVWVVGLGVFWLRVGCGFHWGGFVCGGDCGVCVWVVVCFCCFG
ncbi:hypothetical protein, partial [Pseudomonas syringae group genomosp. 7]|uniref:hypothetical protein n=1 Tax=Pseudomonas syringae group genomosp. 7 TaxID=251699 RepID=UPI00376FB10D